MNFDLVNAQSWVPYAEKLWEAWQPSSVLEFGLGYGTRFFLERCERVVSVELVARDEHRDWYAQCLRHYTGASNWEHVLYECGEAVRRGNDLAEAGKTRDVQPDAVRELERMVDQYVPAEGLDLVFVDPGIHLRGQIVRRVLGRVPVVMAHDTHISADIYGWDLVGEHPDYRKLEPPGASLGTAFWIKEDLIRHHPAIVSCLT